jgi:hypothetical protein
LCTACPAGERGEVSALELERELGLPPGHVRDCLQWLVEAGAVDADLFPLNVWATPTGDGHELLARWASDDLPSGPIPRL